MKIFKSKEEKEKEQLEKLNTKMQQLGLQDLSIEEKEQVKSVLGNLSGTTLIAFGANATEDAIISLLQAQIEQNWLLLKKLNSIEQQIKSNNKKTLT